MNDTYLQEYLEAAKEQGRQAWEFGEKCTPPTEMPELERKWWVKGWKQAMEEDFLS